MIRTTSPLSIVPIVLLTLAALLVGCQQQRYDPDRATRPFPSHLHQPQHVDVQVFRDGTRIEIVNATARSYRDFDLWINQRYVKQIDALPAGETRRFSLWEFYDERGETMNAGGFFRTYEPDPVVMAQIQVDDESPLIGLVVVREEPLEAR